MIVTSALIAALAAAPLSAPSCVPLAAPDTGIHQIHWYEAAAVLGGTALVATVDPPVERFFQRHRSATSDDLASGFRQMGEPIVNLGIAGGIALTGLVLHKPGVRDAGYRATASVLAGAAVAEGFKLVLGRGRPNAGVGAYDFKPFTTSQDSLGVESRSSFPSGHSMAAFALATSLSDDIHRTPVTIALYTAATGTALSRLNDDRHWLSDVVFGAALGITSAKVVRGRWRVFGLRPPAVLVAPAGLALGWTSQIRF